MAKIHRDLLHPISFVKKRVKRVLATPIVGKYAHHILEFQDWFILPTTPEQKEVVRLIKRMRQEARIGLNNHEAYQIYITVKNTNKIKGAIAEVGVFKGGTARLMCEVKGDKKLYLFDTFEGLPPLQDIDKGYFHEGQFPSTYEEVSRFFVDKNVVISKGIFPKETGHVVANEQFSFVHLDVDLYQGTKDSLEFFYPRMSKGGVIISHDYVIVPGVRKAFDDFFKDKLEVILEPSRSQALVVKL